MPPPVTKVVIFGKGGRVVWSSNAKALKGEPLNRLVQTVLLEEKGQKQSCAIDSYRVEWRLVNEADVVIACLTEASYDFLAGDLLEATKKAYLQEREGGMEHFSERFSNVEKELEGKRRIANKSVTTAQEEKKKPPLKKKGKEKRDWGADSKKKISAEEALKLDYSAAESGTEDAATQKYLPSEGEIAAWEQAEETVDDDILDDDDDDETISSDKKEKKSFFSRLLTGGSTLTEESVAPIMEDLRVKLIGKNVASEIASEITQNVSRQLVGKRVERFQRAKAMVQEALVASVERVLTPRTSTDVLASVLRRKNDKSSSKKPFVIVFVGINGVGKSTTLSKVAYYLKAHGASILIAACDTFRSGAVEQLRSHAKCLDVELFERGYLKDPSDVAKAAIDHATKENTDVVLVDTAGRMQNNASLMRQLARLLQVNDPDVCLFVGEALVGNDGIDQLNMFDQALKQGNPLAKSVDGLVLTKFDCIDDKVGAVLSMTYKTGLPVAFVGVGQKYTHLKKLSVNNILNSLFKR